MTVKIMPISDLRRRASDVIRAAQEEEAVYITQHGRPIVVLIDYERYERLRSEAQPGVSSEPPGSYTDYLSGLHRQVWEGVDTDAYLQREREAWPISPAR